MMLLLGIAAVIIAGAVLLLYVGVAGAVLDESHKGDE